MALLPSDRLAYAARAARAVAREPSEGVERVAERVCEWRDRHGRPFSYRFARDLEQQAHERLSLPWPCPETGAAEAARSELLTAAAERGLAVGRGAYGGWDDADERLARLAWCLVRHLRPSRVVETGVARGFTSATILQAMARNGSGGLWSVDLPPLLHPELSVETGAAVPAEMRDRWTLVRGSSRRVLPALLDELGPIGLFLHDSMHTTRNVSFELDLAWPHLVDGGVTVVDDVQRNRGFGRFARTHGDAVPLLGPAEDGRALIGCLLKESRRASPPPARAG